MLFNNSQKLGVFCLIVFSLIFIILMQIHLMPALIAGLLIYILTLKLDCFLAEKMTGLGQKSKLVSVILLLTIIMSVLIGGTWYLFTAFVDMARHPTETMNAIKPVLDNAYNALPASIKPYLPDDIDSIRNTVTLYLKEHIFYLQSIVTRAFHILVILIVGMIIGLILAFKHQQKTALSNHLKQTVLVKAYNASLARLVVVFQYVAISQFVIALFNAIMTAIFLFIILPIFGIHLPFSKSLVLATFVFGLIPIIGNLVVNLIMFLVAFTVSLNVAIIVIIYLVLIHKVEYILNAKIVGTKIHASICELLIAMLFFETLFGVIGLVFAPIFYAFIKLSLKDLRLI